jgi:hypothetical protein
MVNLETETGCLTGDAVFETAGSVEQGLFGGLDQVWCRQLEA